MATKITKVGRRKSEASDRSSSTAIKSFNATAPDFGLPTSDYLCFMEVSDALVDKLAHLSRLQFDATEKQEIRDDLQRMIGFVEKLNELNLDGVEPLLFMSDEVNVLREDSIKGSITREQALKNAPLHDGQFFKVPKVIKK